MTKGHNKGNTNDRDPENKTQGQDRHLPDSKKEKSQGKGRSNKEEDPSGGTKGQNAI